MKYIDLEYLLDILLGRKGYCFTDFYVKKDGEDFPIDINTFDFNAVDLNDLTFVFEYSSLLAYGLKNTEIGIIFDKLTKDRKLNISGIFQRKSPDRQIYSFQILVTE